MEGVEVWLTGCPASSEGSDGLMEAEDIFPFGGSSGFVSGPSGALAPRARIGGWTSKGLGAFADVVVDVGGPDGSRRSGCSWTP